jgi:hypothetical protein
MTVKDSTDCNMCGEPRKLVGITRMNRPLLHCMSCDRKPTKKRRIKRQLPPSH